MSGTSIAFGTRGVIVSGHPLATQEGWRVLDAGGTVVDAAVAAATVLAVVAPQACTIGGDAFILVHSAAERRTHALNASGPAAGAADPERFRGGIPGRGGVSVTVPGVIRGWEEAHRRFGRTDWTELLAPAIRFARDGFPVSPGLARASEQYRWLLETDRGSQRILLDNGAPLRAGAVLRQPALAETLARIARGGSAAFYEGPPAESAAAAVRAAGGLLLAKDFRRYRPEWVEPIGTEYRGLTVRVMPPNSYGLYLLMQLDGLAGFDLARLDARSGERFALLVAAALAAFAEGGRFVADPAAAPPVREALCAAMHRRLRGRIGQRAATPRPSNAGGTAVVSVADAAGNGVTIVQSVFLLFGSGVTDPETGVLFNNRMLGFATDPRHPNAIGPGKRPAHTLCPVMGFVDGRLRFLMGTPGGPGQTITLTRVLSGLVDHKMDLAAAVAAPRWSMNLAGEVLLEAAVGDNAARGVGDLGLKVERVGPGNPFFGSAEAIEIRPDGVLVGVADRRREAAAMGVC